jgi:hypothetical protein
MCTYVLYDTMYACSEVAQREVVLNKMPLALGAGNEGSWGGKTGCETVLKPPQKPFTRYSYSRYSYT